MEELLNVGMHDWNLFSILTKDVIITYEVVIFSLLCSIFPEGEHKDPFNVFPLFANIKNPPCSNRARKAIHSIDCK